MGILSRDHRLDNRNMSNISDSYTNVYGVYRGISDRTRIPIVRSLYLDLYGGVIHRVLTSDARHSQQDTYA